MLWWYSIDYIFQHQLQLLDVRGDDHQRQVEARHHVGTQRQVIELQPTVGEGEVVGARGVLGEQRLQVTIDQPADQRLEHRARSTASAAGSRGAGGLPEKAAALFFMERLGT